MRLVSLKTLPAGDTLLWKTLNDKRHPISGAVHGMTGIAEALLMAGRLLQTDDFAPAAADAGKSRACGEKISAAYAGTGWKGSQ